MIESIRKLFEELNNRNVRYCHWKSNVNLKDSLNAKTDIDLLVDRRHINAFESVVASMRFKMSKGPNAIEIRAISHYYGLDDKTGILIHLHVYYRITTCGSLLKNYRLPLEEMLLQNTRYIDIVRVPEKAAELALLVIRKTLEHCSFVEMIAFYREYNVVKKELAWLLDTETEVRAVELMQYWLPDVDKALFLKCISSLKPEGSIRARMCLARKMSACLKTFKIHGTLCSSVMRSCRLLSKVIRKCVGHKGKKTLITNGAIIAIAGPDATGKSTIQNNINHWLRDYFYVVTVHAGKPPSTWVTFLPNMIVPFTRTLIPSYRSNKVKENLQKTGTGNNKRLGGCRFFVFCARSVMLAFDRYRLLQKAFRKTSKGTIVICDRYPTRIVGAMDSPQLHNSICKLKGFSFGHILEKLEKRFYNRIPPPDIVIRLTIPLETAIKRNSLRNKKGGGEDEDFIRKRHEETVEQEYISGCVYDIDTNKGLSETVLEVKRAIWKSL